MGSEIFIGLVGAVGTDLKSVALALESALRTVRYETIHIRVIEEIHGIKEFENLPETPVYDRYIEHMNAGDSLRRKTCRNDALARLSIVSI